MKLLILILLLSLVNETFLFFLNLTSEVTINYNIPANSQINIINIYKNRECEQIANLFYNLLEKAQVNIYHLNIVNSSITENITFNLQGDVVLLNIIWQVCQHMNIIKMRLFMLII